MSDPRKPINKTKANELLRQRKDKVREAGRSTNTTTENTRDAHVIAKEDRLKKERKERTEHQKAKHDKMSGYEQKRQAKGIRGATEKFHSSSGDEEELMTKQFSGKFGFASYDSDSDKESKSTSSSRSSFGDKKRGGSSMFSSSLGELTEEDEPTQKTEKKEGKGSIEEKLSSPKTGKKKGLDIITEKPSSPRHGK